jgi:chromosome segregation ATPase
MKGVKFAVSLAFLLSAGSLAGNWFLYDRLTTEQDDWQTRQTEFEDAKKLAESQMSEFKKEAERLRTQVKDYVKQRDAAKKELDAARKEIGELNRHINELESEGDMLKQELNLGEVTDKAIVKEAAKQPVATREGEEEAPGEEVTEEGEGAPPEPTVLEDARPNQVLSVNRQFNFVVVNMGLEDRIKIGDTLRVEEGGKLIGRVQVEKLYENFSACTIVEEIKPAQIKEGDLVRLG